MSPRRRHSLARLTAMAALATIAIVVTVMTTGYVRARRAEPRDAARIAELQTRVQMDSSAAALLAREQDRVTRGRQARKRRDDALAWVLLAAAVVFLGALKWPAAHQSARPQRLPLKAIRLEIATDLVRPKGLTHTEGEGDGSPGHSVQPAGSSHTGSVGQGFGPDQKVQPEGSSNTVCVGQGFGQTVRSAGSSQPICVGQGFSPDQTVRPEGSSNTVCVGQGFSPDITDVVDGLIQQHGRGKEAAIPILQAIQAHYRYLPDEALRCVCERTDVTSAQIAGTSSFYARFRRSPVGEHVVRVCHGTACHVAGARQITDELRRHLHIAAGEDTDPSRRFTIDEVACLGCCSLAPVLMVDEHTAGRLTPATATAALDIVHEAERV